MYAVRCLEEGGAAAVRARQQAEVDAAGDNNCQEAARKRALKAEVDLVLQRFTEGGLRQVVKSPPPPPSPPISFLSLPTPAPFGGAAFPPTTMLVDACNRSQKAGYKDGPPKHVGRAGPFTSCWK